MKTLFATLAGLFILAACTPASSKVNYKYLKPTQSKFAAKYKNIEISRKDMMKGLSAEIYKLEKQIYELKFNKVKSMVIERIIEADPKSKGITPQTYLDKFISSKIEISAQDIEGFIKEKNIPAKHINDKIKVKIKEHLRSQKTQGEVEKWLAKQTASNPIELYLDKPEVPRFKVNTANSPMLGSSNAKVTVVEFSDFQCPFCAKGADIVKELKKKYAGKVNFVFKHFPLPFHKQAEKAAVASMCVHEQNKAKFWNMHDDMFADQSKLSEKDLTTTAKKLGVDVAKFETCLKSMKYLAKVKTDIEEGKELGINSTPTFYVNGKIVSGARSVEFFSELIDEEL